MTTSYMWSVHLRFTNSNSKTINMHMNVIYNIFVYYMKIHLKTSSLYSKSYSVYYKNVSGVFSTHKDRHGRIYNIFKFTVHIFNNYTLDCF